MFEKRDKGMNIFEIKILIFAYIFIFLKLLQLRVNALCNYNENSGLDIS